MAAKNLSRFSAPPSPPAPPRKRERGDAVWRLNLLTSKPPGFAGLAKRISAWTTRGLLTLMVLVAGLGFGRQVLKWWAADAADRTGYRRSWRRTAWAILINSLRSSSATTRGRSGGVDRR